MFETIDLSERAGSEVRIDRDDLIKGTYAAEIERLLVERSGLAFRGMFLTDDEQKQVASTIGRIVEISGDGVSPISMDPTVSRVADYTRGAFYWHIDGANSPLPDKATMLSARVLAEEGGDTLICNTYAAYADLPDAEKARLDGIRVRHALEATQRMVHPDYTSADLAAWRSRPSQTHPLVWKHRHGRPSLLLGATALYVHDMAYEDGVELLTRLQDYCTQERYVYRHKWQVGDFLLWDNSGTMHRADNYSLKSKRLMSRTTLQGEEPVTADRPPESLAA